MTMCGGFATVQGLSAGRRKALAHLGVRFEHAARDQIADRSYAGARELGEIVLGVKLLPWVAGEREREPDEPAQSMRPRR